jgi:integrase
MSDPLPREKVFRFWNVKIVSERLGHARVETTLNVYSHVMPGMQQQAAEVMQGILYRKPAVQGEG